MLHIIFLFLIVFSPSLATAGPLLDKLEGTYYRDLRNSFTAGEDYWSEDTFKLVKAGPDIGWFRYELNFSNGQTCTLSGIAEESEDKLLYTDPNPPAPPACALRIELAEKNILTSEVSYYAEGKPYGGCKAYCGARGSFDEARFALRSRKRFYPAQIKQMKRSKDFKAALGAYTAWKNKTPP